MGEADGEIESRRAGKLLVGGEFFAVVAGRNLLVGGIGADNINGGVGDDIEIAGSTLFDSQYAALEAILAEWNSAASYATRIAQLQGAGGGVNMGFNLKGDDESGAPGGQTVLDDAAQDSLTGSRRISQVFNRWKPLYHGTLRNRAEITSLCHTNPKRERGPDRSVALAHASG